MAKKQTVRAFNDKNTAAAIRLYKQGWSIERMKRKWRCYGNPIVRRLQQAGVYRETMKVKATTKRLSHHSA